MKFRHDPLPRSYRFAAVARIVLTARILSLLLAVASIGAATAQSPGEAKHEGTTKTGAAAALEKLKLPGVKINLDERCVDVEATVCLDAGMLELVACSKDSKEHESIVAIEAKAMHVHTALLLLGAKSGSPAMRQQAAEDGAPWVDLPARGEPVGVYLVFKDAAGKLLEHPISDFICRAGAGGGDGSKSDTKFPTQLFVFAGSQLADDGPGPRRYLADISGNVISIATFGDELLCLPEVHSHENGALMWQLDPTHLPAVGTKVMLRLRPQAKPAQPR